MKTIAAIFAHPDDAEIWAGGTLKKHIDLGDTVLCYVFYQLSRTRKEECRKSLEILGFKPVFVDTPPYESPDLKKFLKALKSVPDIIITHWEFDTHLEHILIFDFCVRLTHHLIRYEGQSILLLMTSTYYFIGRNQIFEPVIVIDISSQFEFKRTAIFCHKSQSPNLILSDIESQNRILGNRIGKEYAEGFIEYPMFGRKWSLSRANLAVLMES